MLGFCRLSLIIIVTIMTSGCIPTSVPSYHKRVCAVSDEKFRDALHDFARSNGMFFSYDEHFGGQWIAQISSFRSEIVASYIPEVDQINLSVYNKIFIPDNIYNSAPLGDQLLNDPEIKLLLLECSVPEFSSKPNQ